MVLNKRGQVIFYALMLAVVIIILALGLVPVINDTANRAMGANNDTNVGMDCNNASINDYTKSACAATDTVTPYFFFGLLAIALLVAGARAILT